MSKTTYSLVSADEAEIKCVTNSTGNIECSVSPNAKFEVKNPPDPSKYPEDIAASTFGGKKSRRRKIKKRKATKKRKPRRNRKHRKSSKKRR